MSKKYSSYHSSLSRFSDKSEYKHINITFGSSNTDQSFYEPTASLIANAERQGSILSPVSLSKEQQLSDDKMFNMALYTQGMTLEESSQMQTDLESQLQLNQQQLNKNIQTVVDEVVQNSISKD